ncbi:MAG: MFS transporter [Caulobacteraceae bacterium]
MSMAAETRPLPAPAPLPRSTIVAFSAPGTVLAGILLVLAVYLPRFYVGLGLKFVVVAVAIAIVRFVDIWLDPLLGLAMDRTRTPLGRYRLWLIAGAPVAMAGLFMLLLKTSRIGPGHLVLWLLVAFAGYSILNLSLAAWSSVIAADYNERSRLWGWNQGLAVLGSIGLLLLLPLLTHGKVVLGKAASMPTIGWILIAAVPVAVLICALFTPERRLKAPSRPRFRFADYWAAVSRPNMRRIIFADLALTLGPGATAPLYVYFFHDAKGFTIPHVSYLLIFYIGAGLIGAPFWGRVARALGKHRTIQIACVAYAITQTILMALPRVWPGYRLIDGLPTAIGMFGVGFCASAFILLVRAMVSDVVDEVKLEQRQDLTSLLFSMVTSTQKLGVAITVTAVFPILQLAGYDGREGAVNTPSAIFALEMCYLFAPILLVFAGGTMFLGYKLDARRHGAIRAALAEREAALSVASAEETLVGPVSDGAVAPVAE